jgi:DNA-binding XRE family transcriptional regulator
MAAAGITWRQLAITANCTYGCLHAISTGKSTPTAETAKAICSALGVKNTAELFDHITDRPATNSKRRRTRPTATPQQVATVAKTGGRYVL